LRSAPEMTPDSRDPHRLLAGLQRDGVSLQLSTLDLCFLAALHLRTERDGLTSLEEELVLDVFEQICDLVEPGLENRRKRATHTIQRLRDQRMIGRVDATGIVTAGEYGLTRLATVIIKSFLEDEQLTRESLALLTGAVISSLGQIRAAAERGGDESEWRTAVVGPLRVTVGDLVAGIERRQRGLDGQQEEVQRRIGELLQTDWFGAVEQCQSLLEAMTATLQELNEVLLRDASQIQGLLQEIQQAAEAKGANEAAEAAQRVTDHVDRMAAWGSSRQQAWSGYYQYVHRFLRDVVRLDPDRALSQRLLDQVRGWTSRPFALVVASDAHIRVLRSVSARGERPPVGRPRADREQTLSTVAADGEGVDLERLVIEALARGAGDLASVTRQVLGALEESHRYLAMGRIAAIVARLRRPQSLHERPWVPVAELVEIEDWSIEPAETTAK
jgi:chromosome partition protein MukF